MHYPVGSISKQFTAACVLLLVEDGKMTLDDPVSRWYPELTRATDITVRMLLSHTSGYSDYAPQDYTIPAWTKPVDPMTVVREWAGKPLDFEPGTKWQYSNTNFVLAALIVQKVSGMPFWQFLSTRVLHPLALKDVLNLDTDRNRVEPQGYMRNALAPLRPAILEAPGWYFGDATLAMPVADLLTWDISIIDQSLLKPASYTALETEVKLKDGTGSHYGLAVDVRTRDGHREISHSGEVGGFVAQNTIYPDDKIAIAVLTNQEASSRRRSHRAGRRACFFSAAPRPPASRRTRRHVRRCEPSSPASRRASSTARPHRRLQLLLLRRNHRATFNQPRAPRRHHRLQAGWQSSARRHDLPRLCRHLRLRKERHPLHLHHARRQARAVPRGDDQRMSRYDVAVVGAGPAGSTAALKLGNSGLRVLLLEKAKAFPREKPCGGGITARALASASPSPRSPG